MNPIHSITKPFISTLIVVATSLALVASVNAASRETSYTYYDTAPKQGLLQSIDGPRTDVSDITTLDYDHQGNLTLITNALGQSSQIVSHDMAGRPLESISPNALHTTYQYDVRGRLEHSTTFAAGDSGNGRVTTYTYTPAGDIETISVPSGETLTYTYDGARRLIQVTDSQGDYIAYVPDLMGNILSETVHASDTSLIEQQTAVYNQLGQLFQSIGAGNQTTEYGYDLNGNTSHQTDARSNPTTQAFDALNRLKSVIDAKSGETHYGYDSAGNLSTVTDPNNQTTTYTYDGLGNLTSLNSPDTGLTTYDSYDAAGNLLQETNANNIVIHYTYDALNRLTHIQYPNPTQNITYSYDGSNYTVDDQPPASHAPMGQRTGMSDSTGTLSWFYNAHGELIQTSQTLAGGSTFITAHSYDTPTGLHTRTTYPSGRLIEYQYDSQGQVSQINSNDNGTIESLLSNIQYQPFGGITTADYGNGLSLNRTFDLDGRLSNQTVLGVNAVQDLSWDYNPVSSVQNLNNLLDATLTQSFDYDELDRLNSAQTDLSLYGLLGFDYDANGNRIQQNDNSLLTDYTINSSNNQTDSATGAQAQTFQYDNKGNVTEHIKNGDTYTYTYTQQNRLIQISKNSSLVATYTYNGLGQRTSKTLADGTLTYYLYTSAGQLMSEVDTTGTILKEYVYFEGDPLALAQNSSGNFASLVHLNISHQWQSVPLSLSTSETPVIIAGVPSYNDTAPGVIALQNITSTQAEVQFKEWNYLDGTHANETVSLLALAPGRHFMSDGSTWEVGTFDLNGTKNFKTITFIETFLGIPKVFVTAQTTHDSETASIRVKSVTIHNFKTAFNEQESYNNGHAGETIGYVAIHSPTGSGTLTLDGQEITYNLSSTSVNNVFSSVQSGHSIKVEEEQSQNTEVNHVHETVATLNLQNHLFAQMNTTNDDDSAALRRQSTVTPDVIAVENAALFYYHNDHLGTPQTITDENQQVVWQGHYSPFGEVTLSTATIENNLRFAGQYFDDESGLHYNYFRYYDPSLGRYITSDPVGLDGGLNTYAYVENNPLNLIDPTGETPAIPAELGWAIGTGIAKSPWGKRAIIWGVDKVWEACHNDPGGDDDECKQLQDEMRKLAQKVNQRANDMLIDKCNQYNLAYSSANPQFHINPSTTCGGNTTWLGHQKAIKQVQNRIMKLINKAQKLGCVIPPNVWKAATRQIPQKPRGLIK